MNNDGTRNNVQGVRKVRPSIAWRVASVPFFLALGLLFANTAHSGTQAEEVLSASVRGVLQRAVSDRAAPKLTFPSQQEADLWLSEMSHRIARRMPDADYRLDFLKTVHYEATRAGLDPQMVLGLIEVESGFKKYAVSEAGARGYMQVMPFWVKEIGTNGQNLFHLSTNLRYGCTILRHYIDMENGDLYRALGRYNGSLGRPEYPNMVRAAWYKYADSNRQTAASTS
jgi:soluble lytic murein transglycosylase-like protein